MVESISGDRAQIISKAILDFFIALIYGGSMGIAISLVAVPQLAVFTCFFFLAKVLIPMMSDAMLTNFIACGGVLSIAAHGQNPSIPGHRYASGTCADPRSYPALGASFPMR